MPFSPEIYGAQAATALNALSDSEQGTGFVMFTKTKGTLFEADLLLSCAGLFNSPVHRLMLDCRPGEGVHWLMLSSGSENVGLAEKFLGKKSSSRLEILGLVRRLRSSLPRPVSSRSGPAFSDAKFGPRVAKVLNALLALEIAVAGDNGVDQRTDGVSISYPQAQAFGPWDERPAFALQVEEGTTFAAELLLHRAGALTLFLEEAKERKEDFGIMDALFPAFGKVPTGVFSSDFSRAVTNARVEMYALLVVVVRWAMAVLMAGVHRLGRNSPLATIDQGVLKMIVEMVIADLVKDVVAHAQQ